jgi:hypothetical protein
MDAHLTDEALNEYLDAAPRDRPVSAGAHLAGCAACAARLAALRLLFEQLDALPAVRLERDLAAAVLQSLPEPRLPAAAPPLRRRALRWLSFAQLAAAALLSAIGWPFAAAYLETLDALGPDLDAGLAQAISQAQALLAAVLAPSATAERAWAGARAWLAEYSAALDQAWPLAALPPLETALALVAVALAWAVGSALLLRGPLTLLLRRRS